MITRPHAQRDRAARPARAALASRRRSARALTVAIGLLAALGICSAGCSRERSLPGSPGVGVTPSSVLLDPGQKVRFQSSLVPPVSWAVVEGYGHGVVSADGEYQAPYFGTKGGIATVRANGVGDHADAHVTLSDGPADRDACFGRTQDHLPAFGEYVYVEQLPEALYRVPPSYPEPARLAGVQGTVLVMALVCSSGQVIETKVSNSIAMLDDAAQEAVRQWVFLPAKASGEPIAVWVGVPVRFSLH
jgi:protein TonB